MWMKPLIGILLLSLCVWLHGQPADLPEGFDLRMNSGPGVSKPRRISEAKLNTYRSKEKHYTGIDAAKVAERERLEAAFLEDLEGGDIRLALNSVKSHFGKNPKIEDVDLAAINYGIHLAEKIQTKGDRARARSLGTLLVEELESELEAKVSLNRAANKPEKSKKEEQKESVGRLEALGKVYLRLLNQSDEAHFVYQTIVDTGVDSFHARSALDQMNRGQSKEAKMRRERLAGNAVNARLNELLEGMKAKIAEERSND